MITKIIVFCFLFGAFLEAETHIIFGCGRKFKNGRKCKRWDCPNQKQCPFSEYYED